MDGPPEHFANRPGSARRTAGAIRQAACASARNGSGGRGLPRCWRKCGPAGLASGYGTADQREGKRGFKATYDSRARTPRQPKSQWDRGFGTASGKSAAASGMWRPFEPKGGTGHRPGSTPDGTKRLSSWVDPTVLVHDGTAHNGAILGCVRWFESYLSSSSPRPVRAWAGLSSGEATVWRPATEHMTRPKSARGRFA